ncbi:DUF6470 family protein [Paenibacillus anaericanus]|nr:DUF6470 family protein [Paenibacillus anaericanus]
MVPFMNSVASSGIKIYQTSAAYTPAELNITTRNPEMQADWIPVWEELGLPQPSTVARELVQKRVGQLENDIAEKSREGDRIANISSGEKNVFGKIAMERYMRQGQSTVVLMAIPSRGLHIDVKIYSPEINIEVRGRLLK